MLNFRHQVQVILKKVFTGYFILQLIVFLFLFVIYYINLETIKGKIKSEVDISVTKFKSIFLKYYQQKFTFLIEDLMLVQNTFNQIAKDKLKDKSNFLDGLTDKDFNNCINLLSASTNFGDSWYNFGYNSQQNYTEKSDLIMKGSWAYRDKMNLKDLDEKVKFKLGILCKMNFFLKKLFDKNVQWSFKMPIQIDFIHFSFNDELFYKFPLGNSTSFQSKDLRTVNSDCKDFDLKKNFYNPKCRTFYNKTISSNYTLTTLIPYIFASTGKLGTEICMKVEKPATIENEKEFSDSIYPATFCFMINYEDLESLRSQFKGRLSSEKVYIIYTTEDLNNIKDNSNFTLQTLYSSDIRPDNSVNLNIEMGFSKNGNNDFFDELTENYFNQEIIRIYNKNETDENKKISIDTLNESYQKSKETFKDFFINDSAYDQIYKITKTKYENDIKKTLIEKIKNLYNNPVSSDISKNNKQSIKYEQFQVNSTTNILDTTPDKKPLIDLGFYVYPANIEFDEKDNKVMKLERTRFYIILLGKFSNDEIFGEFQITILKKFCLFLICIFFFNIFLLFFLTHLFFYIFYIFFNLIKDLSTRFQNLYYDDVNYFIIFYYFSEC